MIFVFLFFTILPWQTLHCTALLCSSSFSTVKCKEQQRSRTKDKKHVGLKPCNQMQSVPNAMTCASTGEDASSSAIPRRRRGFAAPPFL